jgi:uncharacterized protein (TIGR03032 family)
MRLSQPFVRLPLRVDADTLAAEVGALSEEIWKAHPEGAPGNTAVPLLAVGGDAANDSTRGAIAPTPYLDALPYLRRVLGALDTVVGRSRLMRIEEEGELDAHVDINYYWRDHLRVHVPVLTTPDVKFVCGGAAVNMAAGEVWVFDTWRRHGVRNPAQAPRVHAVIDTVGSAALWNLIEHPDSPERFVPVDGPEPALVTEAVNYPVVMTPWELERTLDDLLGDCSRSAPEVADSLEDALRPLRHEWRATWARFGDAPEGRPVYESLRTEFRSEIARVAGDARLPNHMRFEEAAMQLVVRPSLADEADLAPRAAPRVVTRPTSPAAEPSREAAPSGPMVTVDRPVFVVSSPRSGSTLLFETLARAPDLYTIGGESHQLMEAIPQLHPSAHNWDSNRVEAVDATPEVIATLHRAFVAQLRDRDQQRPTGGPVRMLEKTPKNSLRIPFLAEAFPDALFVYLYRDPRETISSMFDAWRSGKFRTYANLPDWKGSDWSLLLVPGWRELSGKPLAQVVTSQWATATTYLLDDLEQLEPDRWCVTSYDRLVGDPQSAIEQICEFCDLEWDVDLSGPLPLARHTLDSPHPDKWQRNAKDLEPYWEPVREVAIRAHDVFATPPRVKPVRRPVTSRVAVPAPAPAPPAEDADAPFRSSHTPGFLELLTKATSSLLVSTYQSGRVIAVRADGGQALNTHFRSLRSPMGMAYREGSLAIGTAANVEYFQNQPAMVAKLDPPDKHDACFMPRHTHATGDIRIHDLAWAGEELWAVNTRFSCLVTFDFDHSFVPRWRPPFVTALAAEDRCHLNGLAVVDGAPRYVTALGTTDEPGGWRENKAEGGVLLDVGTGEPVATGLCMPHSPRWYDGRLWVLESGKGSIGVVDLDSGGVEEVARMPGFTRGLAFIGPYALVGLSEVREHLFEGLPLTAEGIERTCGVWVVDLRSGDVVSWLRFEGQVREIFEVTVLEGIRMPEIVEPGAELAMSSFVLPDAALADVPRVSGPPPAREGVTARE